MSADQAADFHPAQCPLCGESNQCARAADPEATDCWCKAETFPQDLLARVPAAAVRRACICQRCVTNHGEEDRD